MPTQLHEARSTSALEKRSPRELAHELKLNDQPIPRCGDLACPRRGRAWEEVKAVRLTLGGTDVLEAESCREAVISGFVDAGLLWTAGGTLVGCVALGVGVLQVRLQARELQLRHRSVDAAAARHARQSGRVPLAPPLQSLPVEIRGRSEEIALVVKAAKSGSGRIIVLAGMGGIGKSTIAATAAEHARQQTKRIVWWVSAAQPGSLTAGMLSIARGLGASVAELDVVASSTPEAPQTMWTILDRQRQRWLLIIDNADDPSDLAVPGVPQATAALADGRGWLRVSRTGVIVVTTRLMDTATWGRDVDVRRITRLDAVESGRILLDLAPRAGARAAAERLGERLGGHPLTLHLVGSYLGSDFSLARTFGEYHEALDDSPRSLDLLGPDPQMPHDDRATVMYTWETSLDALERSGVPQARTLLRLLSCFAAATPIPRALTGERLAQVLAPSPSQRVDRVRWLEQGMRGLVRIGLVTPSDEDELLIHPVVADVSQVHLETAAGLGDGAPATIRRAAIDMLVMALADLRPDQPEHWPVYLRLVPHARALLTTVADRLDAPDLARFLPAFAKLADYFEWSGAAAPAEELCRSALERASALPSSDAGVLEVRFWLGRSIALQGRWQDAEIELRELLRDQETVFGSNARETLRTRAQVARIALDLGRSQEAEAVFRAVLDTRKRVLGEGHLDTLSSYHELGWVLSRDARWAEAESLFRVAAEGRASMFGMDHPQTLASRNRLAMMAGEQGRFGEAKTELLKILELRRRRLGAEHHDTLATRERLGWVYALEGRLADAESELRAVIDIRIRVQGADYPSTLDATIRFAQVVAKRGRIEEAIAALRSVHEHQSHALGADNPRLQATQALIESLTTTNHGLTNSSEADPIR
jgi:tetratricopeptide (TPR) repeat protein